MASKKTSARANKSPILSQDNELTWRHELPDRAMSDTVDSIQVIPEAPRAWTVPSTEDNLNDFEHELVRSRYFYPLPIWLCESLDGEEFKSKVDPKLIDLEMKLTEWAAENNYVAVHNGHPYYDPYREIDLPQIYRSAKRAPNNQLDQTNVNAAQLDNVARIRNRMVKLPFVKALRGYQGWLMTNFDFLEELDKLLLNHGPELELNHFDATLWHTQLHIEGMQNNHTDSLELPQPLIELQAFLARWRLSRLAGPYYPIPQGPLASGVIPQIMFDQLQSSGGFFYLPDTIPIPSRDELRDLITGALTADAEVDHLAEWKVQISSSNPSKAPIHRYARQFQIQHCWRLLHDRHSNIMKRNKTRLKKLLGDSLGASDSSIKADFKLIEKRLGKDWGHRGFQLPVAR
ncbi:hypothetical protein [Bremerella sp. P1]|uniref:hypothetical protein n=1 Tax=Bremerella sp. P1 TaxID=3026424 RepID=UPI0023677A8F|nr:hypothetical protein [Bremerella sp. P1]WDI41068.1 hypothetical protein PSR63_21610 [Bremerella sp. P1]